MKLEEIASAGPIEALHHRYGPSSMKYRAICPGFTQDQTGDKSKADEGTLMHLAFEHRDLSILHTEEQRIQVQKCIDLALRLEVDASEIHREVKLVILGGRSFGTADEVIIRPTPWGNHADIIDEKYGLGAVDDPEDNWQGWSYVTGVFDRWDVASVSMWFILPRRDEVLKATFHRHALVGLKLLIAAVIDRAERYAKTGDATLLRLTEEGCTYCGAKATCPAMKAYTLATTAKYATLEVVEDAHSSQITDPLKMIRLYQAALILEKMIESVKVHAKQMASDLGGLHGADGTLMYTIAQRSGTREIKHLGLAIDCLKNYLSAEEILSVSKTSLAGALKLIYDKAPRGKKTAVVGAVEAALAENEAVTSGEPTYYLKKVKP
jgi:uncharacterized protein DUF2800